MLHEYTLDSPHGTLNIAQGPPNGPLLILLHGFTNRWQVFLPILPALIDTWQVVTFDHRGHGRSARVPGGYTAAGFFEDAETVLEVALRLDGSNRPAVLLGHSMGGSLALHLAQAHPQKVRALVTGDTSLDLAYHIQVMNNRRNRKLFGLRRKLAGRPLDELIRRGLNPEEAEEMSRLDPHVMDYHAEGQVEGFFEGIADVDFDLIRCPLLLTQANPAKGGLLQDAEIQPVLANHPQFHFQRFDCGHDLEIEQGPRSAFILAALAFLNQLDAV
jgi:pimeloyl-ACP methyl ester carboxylesterase